MKRRHFKAGETIFQEGDPSDEAFVIHSGQVEILKATPDGEARLAILGDDDVFGEMGILEERPRSATARAVDDVNASSVNHEEFVQLILNNPQEGMSLLAALFERLRTMNQMVLDYQTQAGAPSAILASHAPPVRIFSDSPETEGIVPTEGLPVTKFPFRIGREPASEESAAMAFNDLSVADHEPFQVSLNHCAIDLDAEGILVRDRGSKNSTRVNGAKIGARAFRHTARLKSGDNEVLLGETDSPFRLRVTLDG